MTYSLCRTRDGAGDSGPLFVLFRQGADGGIERKENPEKPEIGWGVQVGSIYARSFTYQDWWATTPVTEILEDKGDYVRFRTGNSEYEWRRLP